MSFILDALRKSEHERQKQTGPGIANPYAAARHRSFPLSPPWIIAIGALLVVNLIVVLVLVIRGEQQQQPSAAVPTATPTAATAAPPSIPPDTQATNSMASAPPEITAQPEQQVTSEPEPQPAPELRPEFLPTIHELNLRGAAALPELHLDIHVYAPKPAERFVFINMRKYREGGQMPEGIEVERITKDGVVLDRNGMRFLLPRQ